MCPTPKSTEEFEELSWETSDAFDDFYQRLQDAITASPRRYTDPEEQEPGLPPDEGPESLMEPYSDD